MVNATPRPLYPRERLGTHCIGGGVGPRAGLDGCGKPRPHRDSIPGPSLYRLRYPGSPCDTNGTSKCFECLVRTMLFHWCAEEVANQAERHHSPTLNAIKWAKHENNFTPSFIAVAILQYCTTTDTLPVPSYAPTSAFRTK